VRIGIVKKYLAQLF